jgi:hypothetical protein
MWDIKQWDRLVRVMNLKLKLIELEIAYCHPKVFHDFAFDG